MLGLCNPPCRWTGTVGSSLPGFTIAPCVDSLLYYSTMSLMTVSTAIMTVYTLQRLHNFTHRLVIPSPVGD
jgi:hypothetical protein